jgi:hypothetical protein
MLDLLGDQHPVRGRTAAKAAADARLEDTAKHQTPVGV